MYVVKETFTKQNKKYCMEYFLSKKYVKKGINCHLVSSSMLFTDFDIDTIYVRCI